MSSFVFEVDGLKCQGCVGRLSRTLTALDGVGEVSVELVSGGTSTVSVTSLRSDLREHLVTAGFKVH